MKMKTHTFKITVRSQSSLRDVTPGVKLAVQLGMAQRQPSNFAFMGIKQVRGRATK